MLNISIIMPCYNCASTLLRAVQSVVNQSDWHELIMLNDASTDNTFEIMQNLAQQDQRIKIHSFSQNLGAAQIRNIGAAYASGNVLGFLDADDEHVIGAYSLADEFLNALPQCAALRFGTFFAGFPQEFANPMYHEKIITLLNTFIPNLFIYKSVFNLLGGFPVHPIFRVKGGEDGVLSYLLQQFFLVGTNYENEMLIHHWHENVHAEKFLRTDLNAGNNTGAEDVVQISRILIEQKTAEINKALSCWGAHQNGQHGFLPVFKNQSA
jgi:glycosyltransferase involved in cell wall biosynthesis